MTREEKIEYLAKAVMTLGELGDAKTAYVLNEIRLEMKSQLELPEGLEEAAFEHLRTKYKHSCLMDEDDKAVIDDFIAGAKYQRKQDQSLIELAEDHAMLAGMNKMKEEMMEKAVEFEVTNVGILQMGDSLTDRGIQAGDKMKIIILKEDENVD